MYRYYPNGVRSDLLIKHAEHLDHQVNVEYLFRRWDECNSNDERVKQQLNEKHVEDERLREKYEEEQLAQDVDVDDDDDDDDERTTTTSTTM